VIDGSDSEFDGEYAFSGFENNAGTFTKKYIIDSKEVSLKIYKLAGVLNGKEILNWFVYTGSCNSVPPKDKRHLDCPATASERIPYFDTMVLRGQELLSLPNVDVYYNAESVDNLPLSRSETYTALFRDDLFKDYSLSYDEVSFRSHKCFLASVSLYFRKMFTGDWKETDTCSIQTLPDIDSNDFRSFLKYLYTKLPQLLVERGIAIWKLCDYFEVLPSVKDEVLLGLLKHINLDNAHHFIPIMNKSILEVTNNSKELQKLFIKFVATDCKYLAKGDFCFGTCAIESSFRKLVYSWKVS
jgi:hypothetical protein